MALRGPSGGARSDSARKGKQKQRKETSKHLPQANLGHHPKEGHVYAWAGRGKSSKTDRALLPDPTFLRIFRALASPESPLSTTQEETPQRHQSRLAPSTAQRTAAAARSRRLYRLERDLQP